MEEKIHILTTETFIPRPCSEVFAFFAAAENLEQITPAELNFRIVSPLPMAMATGTLIDYRLRLFGFPFRWQTLISRWEPGSCFVDEQLRGPYAKWEHTHTFTEVDGGTQVVDVVRYCLPFFPIGQLAYPVVRLQLKRIFTFRAQRLTELLGGSGSVVSY
jgi:ligand-binding SRPBCC domain-containing protein